MTENVPTTDYNLLCQFLGTGVKGARPNRPAAFVHRSSVRRLEVVVDGFGAHVRIVDAETGRALDTWVPPFTVDEVGEPVFMSLDDQVAACERYVAETV